MAEVCETLEKLPPHLPVTVCVEQEMTVSDRTGDRVCGRYSGVLNVSGVGMGEVFSLGWGFYPVVSLKASEEL